MFLTILRKQQRYIMPNNPTPYSQEYLARLLRFSIRVERLS
nr:hypothetical protein [Okeania sp. SIO2F4]